MTIEDQQSYGWNQFDASTPEGIKGYDPATTHKAQVLWYLRRYGVAWRWKIVSEEIQAEVPDWSAVRFDPYAELAWAYISDRAPSSRALSTGYGIEDVQMAHQLYANPLERTIVCARILAGQTNPEIAARCGTSRAVLETFKQLFFDVDELLDQRTSIFFYAINRDRGIDDTTYVVWKLCYRAGETAERILDQVPHFGQPIDLETSGGRLRERLEVLIECERLLRAEPRAAFRLLPQVAKLENATRNKPMTIAAMLNEQVESTLGRWLEAEPCVIPLSKTPSATFAIVRHEAS